MKKIILISVASLFFNLFSLFGCRHEWVDATCTAPKCCTKCEATEGEPLGHNWNPATCVDPKTCTVCNTTEGKPVMHNWNPATCEAPKTCADCQATDGNPLGHSYPAETFAMVRDGLSFETTQSGDIQLVARCTVCNGIISSRSANLAYGEPSKVVSNGAFTFTADEYMMVLSDLLPYSSSVVGFASNDGSSYGAVVAPFIPDSTTTMDDLSQVSSFVQFYTSSTSPLFYGNSTPRTTLNYSRRDDALVAMLIGIQQYDTYPELCNDLVANTLWLCSSTDPDLGFHTLCKMAEAVKTTGDQAFVTFGDTGNISVHAFAGNNDGYLYFFISAN